MLNLGGNIFPVSWIWGYGGRKTLLFTCGVYASNNGHWGGGKELFATPVTDCVRVAWPFANQAEIKVI